MVQFALPLSFTTDYRDRAQILVEPSLIKGYFVWNSLPSVSSLSAVVHAHLDKKEGDGAPHMVVMPAPSKRGRKKKTTLSMVGPGGGPGNETFILAHLAPGGQVS